jgi:hypothetical protein
MNSPIIEKKEMIKFLYKKEKEKVEKNKQTYCAKELAVYFTHEPSHAGLVPFAKVSKMK